MLKLETKWTIWQNSVDDSNTKSWSDDLKNIGEFEEIPEYNFFINQVEKVGLSNIHSLNVFKKSIKPMWEDPKNSNGGRLVLDVPHIGSEVIEPIWRITVAYCISNTVDGICGCVYVEKPNVYKFSIWIENEGYVDEVKKGWKEALVMYDVNIYFLSHKRSIDGSRVKKNYTNKRT